MAGAFNEMRGNMTEIDAEIKANRTFLQRCFGRDWVKSHVTPLLKAVNNVEKTARQAARQARKAESLQDVDVIEAIDNVTISEEPRAISHQDPS